MEDANTIAIGFKHGILKFSHMVTSNPFNAFNVRIHFILYFSTKHFKLVKSFRFFSKKYVHVNLEKSSTQTKMYLVPPKLSVCIGPTRSMWRSFRGSLVERYLPFLCMLLVCFPCWQGPQTPLAFFPSLGRPRTQLNFLRVRKS